ncbi:MAG: FG-GAP repeat protein, partial [Planctomycetaceae bacterium]|nr:FG-GAP repeat protein [Planctomycetaceae bacterium]
MRLTHWLVLFARKLIGRRQTSPRHWRRVTRRQGADGQRQSSNPLLTLERLEDRTLLSAPSPLELSSLNGANGYIFEGIDGGDYSGRSVSSAGDVNGDGLDDLLIGAFGADPGSPARGGAGESYLVFGGAANLALLDDAVVANRDGRINLADLNGTTGFILEGIESGDFSGLSVASAGDVNGDGFDDLLIGAK